MLIDLLPEIPERRVLCTSLGMAQFARAAAERAPEATVSCHYLDLYHAEQARRALARAPGNLTIGCAADFPPGEVDLVALPLTSSGEAELVRDLMQSGHGLLAVGGLMVTTTDNPSDTWLHEEMRTLFPRVERRSRAGGAVYLARKDRPLQKRKNFVCEFAFRDRGRLIRASSRPGVFAHRRLDVGARQVMKVMEVAPGLRVLDLGCGSGVLSLAAVLRGAEGVTAHAVDSHARAVECTARGAALNGVTSVTTELNASGDYAGAGTYDLALANPPYYAHYRIAEHFATQARSALKPGGRIILVTKRPRWYAENLHRWFGGVEIVESSGYHLVRGRTPG
jgi:16S rRNA (guanine1207-N2)-methyltransferase